MKIIITLSVILFLFLFNLSAEQVNIAIITTSDLQSTILPFEIKLDDSLISVGGLERISTMCREISNKTDGVLLLSSGDDVIGPLYSIFHGEPEFQGMNLAGYDVYVPGNHEFDFGIDVFKEAIGYADFDVICSNLSFIDPDIQSMIKTYTIKDIAGMRVGIFGLITPELMKLTNVGDSNVILQSDLISLAKEYIDSLSDRNCNLIIALTHTGFKYDSTIAENVENLDIIVGGHDHRYYYENINNTIIVQDGSRGVHLSVIYLNFIDGNLNSIDYDKILLDTSIVSDIEIHDHMSTYMNSYVDSLRGVIGYSEVELNTVKTDLRSRETNTGDLIADSWLDWCSDADVALVNGGSIRGDRVFPVGDITYLTINEILPFRNEIIEVNLKGSDLLQVLEVSASALGSSRTECPENSHGRPGGFFQVSGIKFTVDTTANSFCGVYNGRELTGLTNHGSRISNVMILKNNTWVSLDTAEIYSVLVNEWTASGGDGHFVFLREDINKNSTSLYSTDVLQNFIKKNEIISIEINSRIIIK